MRVKVLFSVFFLQLHWHNFWICICSEANWRISRIHDVKIHRSHLKVRSKTRIYRFYGPDFALWRNRLSGRPKININIFFDFFYTYYSVFFICEVKTKGIWFWLLQVNFLFFAANHWQTSFFVPSVQLWWIWLLNNLHIKPQEKFPHWCQNLLRSKTVITIEHHK